MIRDWITPALLETLGRAGVENPPRDARKLAGWAAVVGQDNDGDWTRAETLFQTAILERAKRKPVSKIIGTRAFWKHDFEVTEDVLDPRPDTETLIELALGQPWKTLLDLGTGSGCILASLLSERPDAAGIGTDVSLAALKVAQRNLNATGVAQRATLQHSDWFRDIDARFDLIVSNPPYIAAVEMWKLQPEVRQHDPLIALTDEADGLDAYRAITTDVAQHLITGGWLMVEIGPTQGNAVGPLMQRAGLQNVSVHHDINGRDRVVCGQMPA